MAHRIFIAISCILLVMSMAGCGVHHQSRVEMGYKTLSAAGIAYDNAMTALADLDNQGLLSEELKEKIIFNAEVYREAHHTCVDALTSYARLQSHTSEKDVEETMSDFLVFYKDFMDLAFSVLRKYQDDALGEGG
jgi:hypothetical protein